MECDAGNVCRSGRAGLNLELIRAPKDGVFMIQRRAEKSVAVALFGRAIFLTLVIALSTLPVLAQQNSPTTQPAPSPDSSTTQPTDPRDPVERSDEFKSKLTFGIYFTPGERAYDLNLRHQFGQCTAWIAGFYDARSNRLLRVVESGNPGSPLSKLMSQVEN